MVKDYRPAAWIDAIVNRRHVAAQLILRLAVATSTSIILAAANQATILAKQTVR